jgi:hypothetical protein
MKKPVQGRRRPARGIFDPGKRMKRMAGGGQFTWKTRILPQSRPEHAGKADTRGGKSNSKGGGHFLFIIYYLFTTPPFFFCTNRKCGNEPRAIPETVGVCSVKKWVEKGMMVL